MKRVIEVFAGDEYKEKVEIAFKKDILFAPVYRQAYKIVEQILNNAKCCENDDKSYAGNNVILFSAERGQGKTSAMLSFRKILENPPIAKEIIGEVSETHFEVMEPIDPSSLDESENIIRVFISRLFYLTEKFIKNKKHDYEGTDEYSERNEINQLLAAFKQCYQNIDSLRKGRDKNDIDDIEELSRLGNSAVLKENLHDLIAKYLSFVQKHNNEKSYLVVMLDDADLFTKNIFEICEDIHDFLSVPNVIIMMAVNYKQLCYNVYQRYLIQYEYLQAKECEIPIYSECYAMAMRYLEKIFPSQHNIELPKIDEMISDRNCDIELIYYSKSYEGKYGKDRKLEYILKGEYPFVILKELYRKTRIVFDYNDEKDLHAFMPRTMRELTHFLKLLNDMENVDFTVIYNETFVDKKSPEALSEIEKLQRNIQSLKQYFLNYWCANHLETAQKRLISDIDESSRKQKVKSAVQLLKAYFNKKYENKPLSVTLNSYQDLMWEINRNEVIQDENLLSVSLSIYFTLFLNEWFAVALEKKVERQRFITFVDTLVASKQQKENVYRLDRFTLKSDDVKEMMGNMKLKGEFQKCLEYFCVPLEAGGDEEILLEKNGVIQWNPELEDVKFDIYRPIMMSFVNGWGYFTDAAAPNRDLLMGRSVQRKIIDSEYVSALHILLANCDLQQYFMQEVDKKRRKVNKKDGEKGWLGYLSDVYNGILNKKSLSKIYPWILDNVEGRNSSDAFKKLWGELAKYRVTLLIPLFLSEPNNRKLFNESFRNTLETRKGELHADAGRILEMIGEAPNVQKKEFIAYDELHEFIYAMLAKYGDENSFYPAIVSELCRTPMFDSDVARVSKKDQRNGRKGANTNPEKGSISELVLLVNEAKTLVKLFRELQESIPKWLDHPQDTDSNKELRLKIDKLISACKNNEEYL